MICEGATEVSILAGLSHHLAALKPTKYADLSALGYCLINSQTDSQILNHTNALTGLGKHVSVFCDAQDCAEKTAMESKANKAFIHRYKRVESLLIDEIPSVAKQRFTDSFDWPQYVLDKVPVPKNDVDSALKIYLKKSKGSGGAMALLLSLIHI